MPDLPSTEGALWPSSLFSCCTGPCLLCDLSDAEWDGDEIPSDPEAIRELREPEGGQKGPDAPKPFSTLRTVLVQGLQIMLIYRIQQIRKVLTVRWLLTAALLRSQSRASAFKLLTLLHRSPGRRHSSSYTDTANLSEYALLA